MAATKYWYLRAAGLKGGQVRPGYGADWFDLLSAAMPPAKDALVNASKTSSIKIARVIDPADLTFLKLKTGPPLETVDIDWAYADITLGMVVELRLTLSSVRIVSYSNILAQTQTGPNLNVEKMELRFKSASSSTPKPEPVLDYFLNFNDIKYSGGGSRDTDTF